MTDTPAFELLTPVIGADVSGIDLRELTAGQFDILRDALAEHLVLRFRGQEIDDLTQLDVNERFGALDFTPNHLFGGLPWNPELPHLETVSNIREDGKDVGSLGNDELVWHSDMSFLKRPYGISILRALELPNSGGNTSFINMYAALERLPNPLRDRIDGLSTLQDGFLTRDSAIPGELLTERPPIDGEYDGSGAEHPLVRTHKETGRPFLYLGRRPRSSIVGLPAAESDALLDELWETAVSPDITWTQEWQVGDIILWDNPCTMHHRTAFDPDARRLLRRTACRGEVPFH